MTDHSISSTPNKLSWEKPALVHLEMGLGDVLAGNGIGTDGDGGISATSFS